MPNPGGFNGVDPSVPPYGSRKQMGAAQASAPLAGGQVAASAQNTPRRARNRAVRQQRPQPVEAAAVAVPVPQAPPHVVASTFWQQAAPLLDPDLQWLANG